VKIESEGSAKDVSLHPMSELVCDRRYFWDAMPPSRSLLLWLRQPSISRFLLSKKKVQEAGKKGTTNRGKGIHERKIIGKDSLRSDCGS